MSEEIHGDLKHIVSISRGYKNIFHLFVCFQLCPDPLHAYYCILGSPCAPSPSGNNSSFLPFLLSLYFPKASPVFLPGFLIAVVQPRASTVCWLAHRDIPVAHAADFGDRTEVFLSIWSKLGLSPFPSCLTVVKKLQTFTTLTSVSLPGFCWKVLLRGPSLALERASQLTQPPKPVRHQHGHKQQWICHPAIDCAGREEAAQLISPNSSKQMICVTLYSLSPLPRLLPFTNLIPSQINSLLYFPFPHWLWFCWLYTLIWWFCYSCPGTSCLGPQFSWTSGSLSLSIVSCCLSCGHLMNITKGQDGPSTRTLLPLGYL